VNHSPLSKTSSDGSAQPGREPELNDNRVNVDHIVIESQRTAKLLTLRNFSDMAPQTYFQFLEVCLGASFPDSEGPTTASKARLLITTVYTVVVAIAFCWVGGEPKLFGLVVAPLIGVISHMAATQYHTALLAHHVTASKAAADAQEQTFKRLIATASLRSLGFPNEFVEKLAYEEVLRLSTLYGFARDYNQAVVDHHTRVMNGNRSVISDDADLAMMFDVPQENFYFLRHGEGLARDHCGYRDCTRLPRGRLTQVSGQAATPLGDVLTPSGDVEEHTLGGEILGALTEVRELCANNPELATLDAALTFLAIVYNSNGTWAATLVAAKNLVKDVSLSMPAREFMRESIARASVQGMSPSSSIFDEFETEPVHVAPEMSADDVRDYVQLMVHWERPDSAPRKYYDGKISIPEFKAVVERVRALERVFERVYGFTGNGLPPYEFARKCRSFKDLAQYVTVEDTLSQNSAIETLLGGLSRAKSASHLIIGNTVILALAGILGMGFLKTHAVVLHEISVNIMGPGRDFAKLVKSLCGVVKDSAIYLAYVLTGDTRILRATEDPLTRSMIAQDRLEADLRDARGDQYQLITTIQTHTSEVGMRRAVRASLRVARRRHEAHVRQQQEEGVRDYARRPAGDGQDFDHE